MLRVHGERIDYNTSFLLPYYSSPNGIDLIDGVAKVRFIKSKK